MSLPNPQSVVSESRAPRLPEIPWPAPHAMIDVGHSRVAYYTFGRGPDVVCVHGWPVHGATWRHVIRELSSRFTFHVIDLPGTGASEWDERSAIDLTAHAATVRAVVDHLGLTRFVYMAHDSGGGIARFAAAGDPRVAGLVLGNTEIPGHTPWQVRVFKALATVPGGGRLLLGAMKLRAIRHSTLGFRGVFTDPAYADGEFGALFVRPLLEEPRVAAGQMRLARTLDFSVFHRMPAVHASLAGPSLLIWGPGDPFFPLDRARAMLPQFTAGAELVTIPGGKLFVHEDHAPAFAAAAAPFLARCLTPPS